MTYSRTERQEFANGVNIIHFPDLNEDKRAERHKQLEHAAIRFMKAVENERRKTNG